MQDYLPQLIQLNVPFIFMLIIAAIGFSAAYYLYRKTMPQISRFSRYILTGIRALIFFLVIFLFFTPSFFLTYKKTVNPKFAIFVDNSKSMGYNSDDQNRWAQTMNALKKVNDEIASNISVDRFEFNTSIDSMTSDSLHVSGKSTDFYPVIQYLKNEKYSKAIIISDGNQTESNYPIENEWPFDTKIYTVGIGPVSSGTDLAISNVIYQPVSYINEDNNIEAQIKVARLKQNENLQLKLYLNNKLIQSRNIDLPKGSYTHSENFTYNPSSVGLNKLKLSIESLPKEISFLNNDYTFVQNILNNKIRIALFAGEPSYESKFISFLLNQIGDFELHEFIGQKNGQFFNGVALNSIENTDILIFCGFPGSNTSQSALNQVLNLVRSKQPSLLVYLNKQTDVRKLQLFKSWLPYKQLPAKRSEREVAVINPIGMSINPVILLFDSKEMNQEFWTKAPPVSVAFSGGQLKSDAHTLVSGSILREEIPLIILNQQNNFRSAVFNGRGFWKWHFLFHQNSRIAPGYQKFLANILRWTNDRTRLKPVILKTENNVVHLGEKVTVTGYIYDGAFQPVKDGELAVKAKWNQQEFSLEAENDSTGAYIIQFIPPGEGKYTITASGFREGIELGNDRLEIEVIPVEKEFINLDQNVDLLKKLAKMGHGYYVNSSQIDSLTSVLVQPNNIVIKDRIVDIWYHPVMLTLIILLISAEWIYRKRLGLV